MNRLLVLELVGADADALFDDEGLENLRRLMDAGVYGRLEGEPGARSARARGRASSLAEAAAGLDPLAELAHCLVICDDPGAFDADLGDLLARVDGGTALLIHTRRDEADGFFAMAGPGVPAAGEQVDLRFADLAPAILKLGGHEPAAGSPLADLVGQEEEPGYSDADVEAIIRERLNGLGYIG